MDITTERVRTLIGLLQGSSMSSILYLFYNADLIEFLADPSRGILVSGFINDVVIIAVNDFAEKNLITLASAHKKATEWATSHGSVFAPAKYELIHFRRLPFEGPELFLRLGDHILTPSFSCKYLGVVMDCRLIWKFHLQHLEKKTSGRLSVLTALAGST